jgi:MFS family permease
MVEPIAVRCWYSAVLPICLISLLYLCSFFLYVCATNSLIYSTICLLRANASFCEEIDRNRTLIDLEEAIQKESSQWSLYGTLAFAIVASIVSPIYGSLSDTKNRKLPIVLTTCNAIITGVIVTIASIYQGTHLCLYLYLLANVVNGFGGGALILIS